MTFVIIGLSGIVLFALACMVAALRRAIEKREEDVAELEVKLQSVLDAADRAPRWIDVDDDDGRTAGRLLVFTLPDGTEARATEAELVRPILRGKR